jgi:hypothetical protein
MYPIGWVFMAARSKENGLWERYLSPFTKRRSYDGEKVETKTNKDIIVKNRPHTLWKHSILSFKDGGNVYGSTTHTFSKT